MRWVVESNVFASGFDLTAAARAAGHQVTVWDDDWWSSARWPSWTSGGVVFHGSLGNAARIASDLPWRPGSFCDVAAFRCSSWYPRAQSWLLNADWHVMPADRLVASPPPIERLFVRPDSPLKPFSGRVLERSGLTLAALDFGFYFDDPSLPVLVAPAQQVEREWRYVVADGRIVAGSAYEAEGRHPIPDDPSGEPWRFAAAVAESLPPPEAVYVLDVCLAGGEFKLLELNPFSGADLYACSAEDVVRAVSEVVEHMVEA